MTMNNKLISGSPLVADTKFLLFSVFTGKTNFFYIKTTFVKHYLKMKRPVNLETVIKISEKRLKSWLLVHHHLQKCLLYVFIG